jgi:hypothetical protein
MKRAVSYLVIGCVLGLMSVGPRTDSAAPSPATVYAAPALALISGTVMDDAGKPLGGALVALLSAERGGALAKSIKSVKTDAEGRFTTGAAPGTYRLRAEAEGFRPKFTLVTLDTAAKVTHNFSLKRVGTLIEQRGDRDDYRWIGRSVPRNVLHYDDPDEVAENAARPTDEDGDGLIDSTAGAADSVTEARRSFHGTLQFLGTGTASRGGLVGANFYGVNFAVSGAVNNDIEVALIGQGGFGGGSPQRLTALASLRPGAKHHVTAMMGYGKFSLRPGAFGQSLAPRAASPGALEQFSVSAVDSWQVSRPLLLIYGFDYSRFAGSAAGRDSLLPRFAVQYSPDARTKMYASLTPGTGETREAAEGFGSESVQARFETRPAEVALNAVGANGFEPVVDRSRRYEIGFERMLDENSSVEAAAFYDLIAGHGVGVLALPLEASPETQSALEHVAGRVAAMNGTARGLRVMYARRVNEYVTASVGYSFGRGQQFSGVSAEPFDRVSPARLFTGGSFQVASAKLDVDFRERTGTRVSTVVRLSPSAVVFAIDPFAGSMSVYDPNISIYVTQELPNFGLPVRWQALVDIRNLLNQLNGVEDAHSQLVAARSQRTVRGGIAFNW